jgi:hypothetical protein
MMESLAQMVAPKWRVTSLVSIHYEEVILKKNNLSVRGNVSWLFIPNKYLTLLK